MYRPTDLTLEKFVSNRINLEKAYKDTNEAFEKKLDEFRNQHSKRVELNKDDKLENFDIVYINIDSNSEKPKYNKEKLTITLGLNLYSKEIEKELIGKRIGEKVSINFKDGDKDIKSSVLIQGGCRNVQVEIDDDFISKLSEEGKINSSIKTFDEYKKAFCKTEYYNFVLTQMIEKLYMPCGTELANMSNIGVDEDILKSLEFSYNEWRENEIASKNNENAELEFYREYFGNDIETIEEGEKRYNDHMMKQAIIYNYANKLSKLDGKEPTKETYDEEVEKFCTANSISREEAENMISFEAFRNGGNIEYLSSLLIKEYEKYIKKEGIAYAEQQWSFRPN